MPLADNTKGALLMMGSMTAFTVNDAFMKGLSAYLPLAQAIFLRGVVTTVLLVALGLGLGQLRLRIGRGDAGLLAIRTLAEIGAVFCFLTAVFNMPLANATAILQMLPLAVTLAGALVLGERVGWRRLTAIAVGFLGVLLIVRPGTEGFTVYSLYVLGAVASVTIRDIAVRRMTADLPSLTVAVVAAAGVMVTSGIVSAFQPWQPVGTQAVALLAGAALCILLAYVLSVATMRVGDISAVAPFRYTGLLVALTLGFVVFGEWPGALTLAGAALVVGSGVFTLLRERRIAHAGSRPPHAPARVDTPRDSL